MKDIINTNKRFKYHGYQECYTDNKKITHRGNWRNNKLIGYLELSVGNMTLFYIR